MFKSYLKIAYRNLLKNKVFSAVNVFGLGIGMAACFFIFLYVYFEHSYDKSDKNISRLYRVTLTFTGSLSNNGTQAPNHPAVGPAMKAEFPEVVDFARVAPSSLLFSSAMMTSMKGDQKLTFSEDRIYFTDPSFLTMFTFTFTEGNPADALAKPGSVVISLSMARKYFGREEPIGKTLIFNGRFPYRVTGVFADVPENTHFKFDMLLPFSSLGENFAYADWTWPEFYTYVLLAPNADPGNLEKKFPAFIDKHLGDLMKQLNYGCQFHMQPVSDIHLNTQYQREAEPGSSKKELGFLSLIGIFILLIAGINYVNLSTARAVERAKEVGIRKVIGAERLQLTSQFMLESLMVNLLALCIAVGVVALCFPFFSQYTGKNIGFDFIYSHLLRSPVFWILSAGAFLSGAMLVGAYPAFVLSSFRPVLVVKGKLLKSGKGIFLRQALVSCQFILSILLIGGTITVFSQLFYMRGQSLGYNKDQMLVVRSPQLFDSAAYGDRITAFKAALMQNPDVASATASSEVPGRTIVGRNSVRLATEDQTHNFTSFMVGVDYDFVGSYQMGMAAGRSFDPADKWDILKTTHTNVVINEELAKALGYSRNEAALSQKVIFRAGRTYYEGTIIGVLKDYHQRSLKEPYDPIIYYCSGMNDWQYFSIRVKTNQLARDIAAVERAYNSLFPGNAFSYFFLDDYFNKQYQSDQRFGKVFSLFTVLAIFIACLGLLGLSSFVVRLRTKEIGIRKVLGASVLSLLVLFSKDFIRLVGLASVIAMPVVYYFARNWLDNYAFHVELGWVFFVAPPLLLLIISLVTINVQSLKAANANPVSSLRND